MSNCVEITVERLAHFEGLPLPRAQTAGAAGFDLHAAVPQDIPAILEPGGWSGIPTGLKIAIPAGHEGQVRPRSGLALNHGVTVLNSPGTIDSDYRGEILVLLINFSKQPFVVQRSLRIAQLVVSKHQSVKFVDGTVDPTARGQKGFGSTGS
jgi:dUTP pyrophosphatase